MFNDVRDTILVLTDEVKGELNLINNLQAEVATLNLVNFKAVHLDRKLGSRQKNINLVQLKSKQISEDIDQMIGNKDYITESEGKEIKNLHTNLKIKMSQLERSYNNTRELLKENLWVAIFDLFKAILGEIQKAFIIISSWAIQELVQSKLPGIRQIFSGFLQFIGVNPALPPGE